MKKLKTKVYFPSLPINSLGEFDGDKWNFLGTGGKQYYFTPDEVRKHPECFEEVSLFCWDDFMKFAENHPTISKTDLDEFYENNVQRKAF